MKKVRWEVGCWNEFGVRESRWRDGIESCWSVMRLGFLAGWSFGISFFGVGGGLLFGLRSVGIGLEGGVYKIFSANFIERATKFKRMYKRTCITNQFPKDQTSRLIIRKNSKYNLLKNKPIKLLSSHEIHEITPFYEGAKISK